MHRFADNDPHGSVAMKGRYILCALSYCSGRRRDGEATPQPGIKSAERLILDSRSFTLTLYSAEDKTHIIPDSQRGDVTIAQFCASERSNKSAPLRPCPGLSHKMLVEMR